MQQRDENIVRVASNSRSSAVAGAIAGMIRDGESPTIQAIGAGAVNQAVKAGAIAQMYLERDRISIAWVPSFTEVMIENKERTAIRLRSLVLDTPQSSRQNMRR